MKYWLVQSDSITNFLVLTSVEEPKVKEITKTEYDRYSEWINQFIGEKTK